MGTSVLHLCWREPWEKYACLCVCLVLVWCVSTYPACSPCTIQSCEPCEPAPSQKGRVWCHAYTWVVSSSAWVHEDGSLQHKRKALVPMGTNSSTGAPLDMIFSHVASIIYYVLHWLQYLVGQSTVPTDYCIWNLIGQPVCLGITPMLFQNDIHRVIWLSSSRIQLMHGRPFLSELSMSMRSLTRL